MNEWEEERRLRVKQTVFSQLITFAHIMVSFEVPTELATFLVNKYAEMNDMTPDDIDSLRDSI